MIAKGFRFGMLLQLAVGPMCLMVFNASATLGFLYGLPVLAAVALIDALYIALSCLGAAAIIRKRAVKTAVRFAGGLVLVLFGANTVCGAFGLSFLPQVSLFSGASGGNLFVQGLLLTASNPLTIIFWSGIFTTQMLENRWSKKQLALFAAGCVMSTVVFLSLVAFFGSLVSSFLPIIIIRILNAMVGAVLIFFGMRLLFKRDEGGGLRKR